MLISQELPAKEKRVLNNQTIDRVEKIQIPGHSNKSK